ncbi:MAG: leucine--tRNA ligase [Patescibacteria group bacterium]
MKTYKEFLAGGGEKKWQERWEKEELNRAEDFSKKPKKYILDMFPYPSGAGLHVGHPEGYTATDIYSRYLRMRGFNVLHPMGWDAFGLPAENYAIQTGTHPREMTAQNIATFKKQIMSLGFSYDWSREIDTTDPNYYKWTQWIFLQLFKKGLAYEAVVPINFCPSCKTGLANEEVSGGKCERCGTAVEKKDMRQWMLRITAYADRLLEGVDKLDWPESIKTLQRNWIGRSEGVTVDFTVIASEAKQSHISQKEMGSPRSSADADSLAMTIRVYTTRPDTLFGATYMVLSPEHKLVEELKDKIENFDEVNKYIVQAKNKSDLERTELNKDKTGVELKGVKAINPVNSKEIPVWISDYVLASYGTGAIMAVPAHDTRDYEFAEKFNLEIIEVISGGDISKEAFTDIDNGKMVNSGFLDGMVPAEAIGKMTSWLEKKGFGKKAVNYKLRDWVFSRQRYWGEPIPLIFCPACKKSMENSKSNPPAGGPNSKLNAGEILNPGWISLLEDDLPLTLPEVSKYEPSGTGESPLVNIENWVKTKCPKCGGLAKRETNTMPQWAGSSWYWLRFIDPQNDKKLADPKKLKYWLPVDIYVGGAEHAVLHLLYARFWNMVLFDIGAVPFEEPFTKLVNQGLILGEDGEKMSKSRGNVVNPDEVVKEHGADAFRMYEMFMGPLEDVKPWNTNGIIGIDRFLEKIWVRFSDMIEHDMMGAFGRELKQDDKNIKEFKVLLNKTIKKVGEDIENMRFNTAISAMMILMNKFVETHCHVSQAGDEDAFNASLQQNNENGIVETRFIASPELEKFLIILSPFAPHLAEELWNKLGHQESIFKEDWPEYDKKSIKDELVEVAIQINGKMRGKISISPEASEKEAVEMAKKEENVIKYLEGVTIKKVIYVKGKIISFVI